MSSTLDTPRPSNRALLTESINESLRIITQIDQKQKVLAEQVNIVSGWYHRRMSSYPTMEDLDKIQSLRDKRVWALLDRCSEATNVVDGVQATLDILTSCTGPTGLEELSPSCSKAEAPGVKEPSSSCGETKDPESEELSLSKQLPGRRCKYKSYQETLGILRARLEDVVTEVRISESRCNTKLNQVL